MGLSHQVQINSEIAEVENLSSHWNLQEIFNDVATRVTGALTVRKSYSRFVPVKMHIEQRVHGDDTGHFACV